MSMSETTPTAEKRKRSVPSMLSRISDAVSVRSRANYSKAIEILIKAQKGVLDDEHQPPQTKLRWRDWLLAFTELCMSFSWGTFIARAQSERTLKMRNMTPRDEAIERLFCNGFAAIGNLLMGHLADNYTRNYGIVLINTAGHFTLASLFFMSEVVRLSASEDLYGLFLSEIFFWLYIPIRSTDFARVVYGMEQLAGNNNALILYFAFIFQLASISGTALFFVIDSSGLSFHIVTFIAFTANAVVLFLYNYVLLPPKTDIPFSRGIAERIWGSVITALVNKNKFRQRIKKASWMDFAETKYDKQHIQKTKKLMKILMMILPTVGFLLFTESSDDFLDTFWLGLNQSGTGNTYKIWIVHSFSIISMLVLELIVFPCLVCRNYRITFYQRFIIGYVALIFALTFAASTIKIADKITIGQDTALLRLFNAKRDTVYVNSYDYKYSTLNYSLEPRAPKLISYITKIPRTLKLSVRSRENAAYILHIFLKPYTVIGYLFVDPDVVYRISGSIPILEAPPGNNSRKMPRCFVVNFIPFQDVVLDVENLETHEKIQHGVTSGTLLVFQLVEGHYCFHIRDTLTKVLFEVLIGGVYGIYIYLGLEDYRIQMDRILPENSTPPLVGLGVSIPMGIAKGVGMVALIAFVFTNSPEGLKGITFGYLFFLKHISSWALLIGFYTWHHYINAVALMIYSVIAICLFFASFVVMLKYRNLYKS